MPEDDPQPTTIPETSVGILLQRGGEEMILLKVSDRCIGIKKQTLLAKCW